MMDFPIAGSAQTYDSTSFAPDSAGAATSIATGHKTWSGSIHVSEDFSQKYETIAEQLKAQKNYKIGILSSVNLNHATPAAFYAHQASRNSYYEIGEELIASNFDYFAGGGLLKPTGADQDIENLYDLAADAGYKIIKTQAEAEKLTAADGKTIVIDEHLADSDAMAYELDRPEDQWSLADYVEKGIEVLDNDSGFFMMVEGGKIDWACHANDAASTIADTIALDDAVGKAVDFYNEHPEETLILVTGDHETGGLTISCQNGEIRSVVMSDHYRLNKEIILLLIFAFFLALFAGKNGFQAILSFLITILVIWKILVPCYLKGYNPIWIGIAITALLTFIIIFFVYGPNRKTAAAFSGAFLGVMTTCLLGILFTDLFQIHGAIMPNAESLLYSGYQHLDLTAIFMSSIFIGASGAMMDLSVDITSAISEVIMKKPDISRKDAILSGMTVGRAPMGTMTTTLLLAYSGGYISLLMVFMAQGTPIDHILNYKYVASEILDTVVGSFGLVTVAPFTAVMAGLLLAGGNKKRNHVQLSQIFRFLYVDII